MKIKKYNFLFFWANIVESLKANTENYKNISLQDLIKYMSIKKGDSKFSSFDYIIQVSNSFILSNLSI